MHPAAVDNRTGRPVNRVEHVDIDDVEHPRDDDHHLRRPRRSSGSRPARPAADGVDEHLVDFHVDDQHEFDDEFVHIHLVVVDDLVAQTS